MQQIIGAIVSLAVALLVTAAGLYFDVKTLTIAGVILFGFASILWIYEWGRKRHVTPQEVDATELDRKHTLIDNGRGLAARFTQGHTGFDSFRQYLEGTKSYAALRGHLSPDYLATLNDGHIVHATAPGARYEPMVEQFLDELDRLEGEWGLR